MSEGGVVAGAAWAQEGGVWCTEASKPTVKPAESDAQAFFPRPVMDAPPRPPRSGRLWRPTAPRPRSATRMTAVQRSISEEGEEGRGYLMVGGPL